MTTEEQIQENRRKGVTWLLTTRRKQGRVRLFDPYRRCYCALGHLGLAVGIDGKQREGSDAYGLIYTAYDLSPDDGEFIWEMNDNLRLSLREIGERLALQWGIEEAKV